MSKWPWPDRLNRITLGAGLAGRLAASTTALIACARPGRDHPSERAKLTAAANASFWR